MSPARSLSPGSGAVSRSASRSVGPGVRDKVWPAMATRAGVITGWTSQHVRHIGEIVKQGRNPAARVYESIGPDFFLAPAPGWLNLGLWEGPGSEDEAEQAWRRLVRTMASALSAEGVIIDVGNGLGTQDPLIAE